MNRRLGSERMKKSHVIDTLPEVRKKIGDPLSALAVLFEIPLGLDDSPLILATAASEGFHLHGLTVHAFHPGLVIKGVDVGRTAIHEEENHALGFRGMVRLPFPLLGHQSAQCKGSKPSAHGGQELTPSGVAAKISHRLVKVEGFVKVENEQTDPGHEVLVLHLVLFLQISR